MLTMGRGAHMLSDPDSIGVVFLARSADGLPAFQRFADSYRRNPAGYDHELIVIYKGFTDQSQLAQARAAFRGLPHRSVELADTGLDIGSYLELSRRVSHRYLLFVNTHSEFVSAGWLAPFVTHISRDSVGIAGATASYESIQDSVALMLHVIWLSHQADPQVAAKLAYYFDYLVYTHQPKWLNGPKGRVQPFFPSRLITSIKQAIRRRTYSTKGTSLIWPGAQRLDTNQFPHFPNPHVRSNGFIIRREHMLSFAPAKMDAKIHASLYESGRDSLTARIRRTGLSALVVGRDGKGYDVAEWSRSGTFRLGSQGNILVADNHTRAFASMTEGARISHARMTWGDYLEELPPDFPKLGFEFPRASLEPPDEP